MSAVEEIEKEIAKWVSYRNSTDDGEDTAYYRIMGLQTALDIIKQHEQKSTSGLSA